MPIVASGELTRFVAAVLVAAGVPDDEAATVARLSVASNLAGHDSHGVALIPGYVAQIETGEICPGASFEIVRQSATTTVIDGHGGFGYVVGSRAMEITMAKAAEHDVAVTTIRGQSHLGRLAAYPIAAARQGFIAIAMASGREKYVAPYGGREARLGTNPISIALPSTLPGVFVLDLATSAVAGGKVRLAQRAATDIPTGWIIDADGRPSTDPDDLDRGGSLLPLGGTQAHKGYALSATIQALASVLPGLGLATGDKTAHGNGCFLACFAVSAFYDPGVFEDELAAYAHSLKATPPADGFDEVLYPGEKSHRTEVERTRDGIPLTDSAWAELRALATRYGVPDGDRQADR